MMRISLRILFAGVFLALPPAAPAIAENAAQNAPHLPDTVRQALRQAGIPEDAVAVVVQKADASGPAPGYPRSPAPLRFNAGRAFNPASLMKLLTTYAALDMLGPEKRWQTTLLAHRLPRDGVLDDDLILRGSGDPALTLERFWLLLHRLRAKGVRDIRGDLVLDRSLFDQAALASQTAAPFDDQPLRPYNVMPDALLVNLKAIRIFLSPGPAGRGVEILAEPHPDNLDILNRIELAPPEAAPEKTGCLAWKDALRASYHAAAPAQRAQLLLEGSYSATCGTQVWSLAPLAHPEYVAGLFQSLWKEMGGHWAGKTRVRDAQEAAPPDALQTLAMVESPPLHQILGDINKYSNNVMARQLYLALGQAEGQAQNPARSEAALRRWLEEKGLDAPQASSPSSWILENGAGLSRHERLNADVLARLLEDAWRSPLMPEFVASLPLAGVDGTMKKRLNDEPLRGRAHIKTGSLEGVSAMAGYVLDAHGRWQIVVFLANHPKAADAKRAQDALLHLVYSGR